MATAELKVRIEAEIKGYQDALIKTVKETNIAENQINKSVQGVANSFTLLNNTKFTFGQNYISASKALSNEAIKSSNILGGSVAKSSNQAAFALTNLGRVAQDAPFGFIGIQNNLNPLLESFQSLKAQTGSTSLAFKALGASLLGPAGLGIALSVVSSAILFYQQYQQKANKTTKQAVDTYKELTDSIKSYSEIQAQGRQNASKDLSQLQSLYRATQNVNIPQAERLKIANELIKQNPSYLKGFSAEEIIAGKAAVSYQKLTQAILAKGLVQAGEANRQKLINKQLEDEVKLAKAQEALNASIAKTKKPSQALPGIAASFEPLQLADAVNRDTKSVTELKNGIAATAKEIILLDNVTQGLVKTFGSEVLFDPEKPKASTKQIKNQADILKELAIDLQKVSNSVDITFGKRNEERVTAFAKAIDSLTEIGGDKTLIAKLQKDLLNIPLSEIKDKGKTVGVSLSTGISDGFKEIMPVVAFDLGNKLKGGLSEWQTYVNSELLPKVQQNFETFFNDILMNGKISFDSLGKAILNTLLSIVASDAARGVTNLLRANTGAEYSETTGKGKGGGLLGGILGLAGKGGKGGGILGLLGIGGKAAAGVAATGAATAATGGTAAVAAGTAATGGLLLPILGGIAAVASIASLFKKKKAPEPQPSFTTSNAISTIPTSNVDLSSGRVVFEISGTNLIGVLNRAGAKLQRFGP